MYIKAFVFAPLGGPEPAPGSDFSPLPLDLTEVAPPRFRRKLPNFPVWFKYNDKIIMKIKVIIKYNNCSLI